ncbi:hypothetical protein N7475_001299 [Penicillium sp. IBT 31633x]|nr:hypothetical protein N7475_001299 [Penicillium sp. IBT 31633x]
MARNPFSLMNSALLRIAIERDAFLLLPGIIVLSLTYPTPTGKFLSWKMPDVSCYFVQNSDMLANRQSTGGGYHYIVALVNEALKSVRFKSDGVQLVRRKRRIQTGWTHRYECYAMPGSLLFSGWDNT